MGGPPIAPLPSVIPRPSQHHPTTNYWPRYACDNTISTAISAGEVHYLAITVETLNTGTPCIHIYVEVHVLGHASIWGHCRQSDRQLRNQQFRASLWYSGTTPSRFTPLLSVFALDIGHKSARTIVNNTETQWRPSLVCSLHLTRHHEIAVHLHSCRSRAQDPTTTWKQEQTMF